VVIAMPVVYAIMNGVRRHYDHVAQELAPPPGGVTAPTRIHGVVLVSKLHTPTLRALAFASATRPHSLVAVTVNTSNEETNALMDEWAQRGIPIPLKVLYSSYRELTRPVIDYINQIHLESPRTVVAIFIPEYVVGHWWEQLLHNQSALRLEGAASLPAWRDGDQRALAARFRRGTGGPVGSPGSGSFCGGGHPAGCAGLTDLVAEATLTP
jgi:hypothetical protein